LSKLRVALVGCGLISEAHVRAYRAHADRAQIVVCFDPDTGRARVRAEEAGGARVADSFEAVLADPEVDAVELCTPHHLHEEAVIAAARAGKHVMCQKPLARNLEECDAMIAAAQAAGTTLFYGEMNRTSPSAIAAKRAIEEGRIGRIVAIQATYTHYQSGEILSTAWRYDPKLAGGGQLVDGGIHLIALMALLGGEVESVAAFVTRFRPELGGEDTAVVNLRYAGGHLGSLVSSHAARIWSPGPSCIVSGSEGTLALGGPHGALTLYRPELPDRREVLIERNPDTFASMTGAYLDTVVDGKPSVSPATAGREDLSIVLAAYRSAEEGREVRVG